MGSPKTVVLGVSGGIAAYKAAEIASRFTKAGVRVYCAMTKSAREIITPLTLQTLSQNYVAVDTFEEHNPAEVEHIALAKKADILLIAPATANVIAKLANGIADDVLTTIALATTARLVIAPAMNTFMWFHPATQANMRTLLTRGAVQIGPDGGLLACGDVGAGRMSEPEAIVSACLGLLSEKRDMEGLRVVVTAGPTREALDPVRFLSNRSSGKMGYAIAEAALRRGAKVTLISGPVAIQPPAEAALVLVLTTGDLLAAVTARAPGADILIQAAAPADFTAKNPAGQKLKKDGDGGLTLELVQTPDVAREAGKGKKPGQTFVGFAAETENGLENARAKLAAKTLDLIALNDVSRTDAGFEADDNALTLISPLGVTEVPLMGKREAAGRLLDEILRLRAEAAGA
ncbi:MAG TPA: bifunctional phosphopantothenoylcysteine decarboxylase/phosphopantothenate--cysteine ligase CoaBC [Candidatus Limnocylindria bacterium]|nr:bifunctional phosphopantothenoylcysteine decarboxylase/phosphopantothenate--cysteine ligase CoaBC [Candidatus Limnocylindria bacterium]